MRGLQNLSDEGDTQNMRREGRDFYWPFVREVAQVHTHHSAMATESGSS